MKSKPWGERSRRRVCILVFACLSTACETKYEGASVSRFDTYASGPYSYSIFAKLDFYGQNPRTKAERIMHAACPQGSPVLLDAQARQISSSKTFVIAFFTCKQLIPGAE
jgi:hypothetical protein